MTQPVAPAEHVAVVFGAGLTVDGTVTAVLNDRVATAADLYHKAGQGQQGLPL